MGFGLPAALGVKVAVPDEQVLCISGDASFQMNLQELATLSQYGIDVKTVILNNGWQGMVRQWQQTFLASAIRLLTWKWHARLCHAGSGVWPEGHGGERSG